MNRLELDQMVAVRPVGPGNWSHDGTHIAFVWQDRSGKPLLWTCGSTGGWPKKITDIPISLEMMEGTDRRDVGGGPQWSPNESRILFHPPSTYRAGQSSVWTVGVDGATPTEITRHVSDDRTARWSPNGEKIAFIGNRDGRDDIQVVSCHGGISTQLTYDRWDNTDLDWSPDGKYIAFISQRSDSDLFSNVLCIVPSEGGAVIQLTEGESQNDRSPRWSPDGKAIVFVSNRNDDDDIWCLDLETRTLRAIAAGKGDKADPRWSPDGKWITYTHFLHGDVNIFVTPSSGGEPRLVASCGSNLAPRWSPDGCKLLYRRAGYDCAGDLWIKNINAELDDPGQRITYSDLGQLDGIRFSKPEVVTYCGRDGLQIEGLLYRAVDPNTDAAPGILWIHGGPNLTHTNDWHPLLQYLAQRGYTIFAPNYRGSTGYGKRFMEANIGPTIGSDVGDWERAAEFLRTIDGIDPRRLAIMGRSAGGYATLLTLGQLPDLFQAGIAISGPSSWLSYWDETSIAWTRRFRMKLMGQPGANRALYVKRSPVTYAPRFKSPVLILHGEADPGVPCGQAREMAAELERCGKAHECVVYPGEGHQFAGDVAIADSIRRIDRFLEAHLPANRKW